MNIIKWKPKFTKDEYGFITFSAILIGTRRTGKSYLVRDLYRKYLHNMFDATYVFSSGEKQKKFYSTFIPKKRIIINNNFTLIKVFKRVNAKLIKMNKKPLNILFIYDDMLSEKSKRDLLITDLYAKGRHLNLSVMYLTQYPTFCTNTWKANSDLIIIFKPNIASERDYLITYIINGYLDKEFKSPKKERQFYKNLLKQITHIPYQALVVDYLQNNIYKIKADKFISKKQLRKEKSNSSINTIK